MRKQMTLAALALGFAFGLGGIALADGADTPQAAAEGLLRAWKAKDAASFQALITAEGREEANNILSCTTLESYEVLGQKAEGSDATVRFKWKIKLDTDKFSVLIREAVKKRAESVADPDERREQIAMFEALLPELMKKYKDDFEREEHTMYLIQDGGRWYVQQPIETQ
ncbi:MAG: hypothetical protein ACYTFT_10600 [Planctomycetota bacterium]